MERVGLLLTLQNERDLQLTVEYRLYKVSGESFFKKAKKIFCKRDQIYHFQLCLYCCGIKGLLCVKINTAQPCLRLEIPPANPLQGSLQSKMTI